METHDRVLSELTEERIEMIMASIFAGIRKMVSDKTLSNLKDYHLPIMVLLFVAGIPVAWFHHLDMAFVAFTGTIVGGITGHSFSPAGRPDEQKDEDAIQKPGG